MASPPADRSFEDENTNLSIRDYLVKNAVGLGGDKQAETTESGEQGGGFLGGIGDKLNSAAGGGKESEKNEDLLDKGLHSPSSHVQSRI